MKSEVSQKVEVVFRLMITFLPHQSERSVGRRLRSWVRKNCLSVGRWLRSWVRKNCLSVGRWLRSWLRKNCLSVGRWLRSWVRKNCLSVGRWLRSWVRRSSGSSWSQHQRLSVRCWELPADLGSPNPTLDTTTANTAETLTDAQAVFTYPTT